MTRPADDPAPGWAHDLIQVVEELRGQLAAAREDLAALEAGVLARLDRMEEALLPATDALTLALTAYRARFGDAPTIQGIESGRFPALAAVLRAAVAEGRPLTDTEVRRRLGMELPPDGAER